MIKHIFKIIWTQRKSNGWLFAELLIVCGAIWMMTDIFWVNMRTYYEPLGYDITNVWRFQLDNLIEQAPNYIRPEARQTDDTEDLLRLMDQVRQNPEVEELCIAYYSCPYSPGNSWFSITPTDGDTTKSVMKSFQIRRVSPEYFDVFRIKDINGQPVTPQVISRHNAVVVSEDMAEMFYPGENALGRKVVISEAEEELPILAVTPPIRSDEFQISNPCYFHCLEGSVLKNTVSLFGPASAEFCVRMRQHYTYDEMIRILEKMDQRLTVNNLFVYGVRSIDEFRTDRLKEKADDLKIKLSLMAFVLLNVFFGIIGTFWLRTQYRRGEIGIRIALGASKLSLKKFVFTEGLLLLFLTIPAVIIFAVNMAVFDFLDSFRLPLTAGRFLITFGITYLMITLMIVIGIWFPARRITRMNPADALHYE